MTTGESSSRATSTGLVLGAVAIAVVTGLIAVLKQFGGPQGLAGLYLLAVVPVAIGWGALMAGLIAVVSFAAFDYFFIPPVADLGIADAEAAVPLVVSLVVAYVVGELARRAAAGAREARLRAEEAEQARNELRRLADEQSALRRVATLVAEAVPTAEVFDAVTREVGLQCDADLARLERFEADRTVTAIAAWSRTGAAELAVGTRFPLTGASIAAKVYETAQPARIDSFAGTSGPIAREAQALGVRASIGCPIVVGGQTWGVVAASTRRPHGFPPDTEARIAEFTELVAAAISNAETRRELIASRARLLSAGDDARRGVARDLHDGAQQRLVQTIMTLRMAEEAFEDDAGQARALVGQAIAGLEQANAELRDLAHGILPPILTHAGLAAGVKALASRLPVPVSVEVPGDRLPPAVEASAYFVVAEALTNVVKHSGAQSARVAAWLDDSVLNLDVRDDGVGGARPDGSGLLGLRDRVVALGGRLQVESSTGTGTRIAATLPLEP